MSAPPVFMLTVKPNLMDKVTHASLENWQGYGYKNVYPFLGVERKTERSKIVMDGWKKFFNMLSGDLKKGLIISEDDVLWAEEWSKTSKKVKMDKVNWLCYQKFFKEKQKDGKILKIPVGAQALYIPKQMINKFKEDLLNSKSIHFDRWLSRLPYIHYSFKPKEACAEFESFSATTGKIRKGQKVPDNVAFTILYKLPDKVNGIPIAKMTGTTVKITSGKYKGKVFRYF